MDYSTFNEAKRLIAEKDRCAYLLKQLRGMKERLSMHVDELEGLISRL